MATPRPEGLSPCYYSMASPSIPASVVFRWTFRGSSSSDYQTKFKIRILTSSKVELYTKTVTSGLQEYDFSSLGYTLSYDTTYYWELTTYNKDNIASEPSVKAKFFYASLPQKPLITWSPESSSDGDVVTRDVRFDEIKANVLSLMRSYSDVSPIMEMKTNNLFIGDIVPLRKDFEDLQTIIQYIGQKENFFYLAIGSRRSESRRVGRMRKWDIADSDFNVFNGAPTISDTTSILDIPEWVGDSLGISDLDKVIDYINFLTNIPPERPQNITIDTPTTSMYDMLSVTASSDGKQDATIDMSWTSEDVAEATGTIHFNEMSDSRDVWFYAARFSFGPNGMYKSLLYYSPASLVSEDVRTFEMNWDGLFSTTTLDEAYIRFEIVTVDNYTNISDVTTVTKDFSSSLKVPIGVAYFEAQAQKMWLSSSTWSTTGNWTPIYKGLAKSAAYKLGDSQGKFYHRVRVHDKSGLVSPWKYATGGIQFDPLTEPSKPGNFRVISTTTSSIKLQWSASSRAESYELRRFVTPGTLIYSGTGLTDTDTNLQDDKTYSYYVRAVNRVGVSDWVKLSAKTKPNIVEKIWTATSSRTWRDNWGWRDTSNTEVFQGEWCEIEGSPNQIAPAGTCWGKNKGCWFFDYQNIQDTLEGKTILDFKIYLDRKDTYHGYYSDQVVHLWLHNYGTKPSGQPMFRSHYEVRDPKLAKGEGAWVNLPNSYAEALQSGASKGFGVYVPNWKRMPYMRLEQKAKIWIKYQ